MFARANWRCPGPWWLQFVATFYADVSRFRIHEGAAAVLIAYNWVDFDHLDRLFFLNQAFLVSFVASTLMALAVIPYAKRRPKGTPTSWGEAMLGSVYAFAVMFVAFGIVPHQFIDHADRNLGWSKSLVIFGPGDTLKPQAYGGWFPFTMSYEAIRDIFVTLIHVWYFALMLFLWSFGQKRGDATPSTEVATSTFGRPLVKKG